MDMRKKKAEQIVMASGITRTQRGWIVPSQSGSGSYLVERRGEAFTCTCPDFQLRNQPCKHAIAIQITILKCFDAKGKKILEVKRVSYSQNWAAYNTSQINEKDLFMKLLSNLCKEIEEPLYRFGRPKLSLADMVFSSALKVYTTFSLRRFMTDMRLALEKGYTAHSCSYSSVSNYMREEQLTPLLQNLITLSSLPLRNVETKFAIDSTGFRTTKFNDYCKEKHNTKQYHQWIKAHICTGVKTNIITSVEVLEGNSADSLQFIPLAEKTHDNGFTIEEMSADKAYNSKDNYNAIRELGGTAYIPFKSNASPWGNSSSKGNRSKLWRRMLNYFIYSRDEFLQHYHLRSNIESTNNMIKAKFTDLVRSKDKIAQINEVLLKVLCHNIVVLIQEINELGIEPSFIQ